MAVSDPKASAAPRAAAAGRALLVLIAGAGVALLAWKLPQWQVAAWREAIEPRDLLALENELRQTVLLAAAGIAIAAVAYAFWRRVLAAEQTLATTLAATQDNQRTERVTRAIEQLAHDRIEVRLGAIFALERLARESAIDSSPIFQLLCAYVRQRAAWDAERPAARPSEDIQAVLTVLGRRQVAAADGPPLDLRRTDLRGADLKDARLDGTNLVEAHLEEASLQGVHLRGADLREAHLTGADLVEAHLTGADLCGAHLGAAYLVEAHLENANLGGAHMEGAYLGGAHLEGADLGGAHLDGAYIYKAHLEGASLHGARILSAIGMNRDEREQINRTASDEPAPERPAAHRRPLRSVAPDESTDDAPRVRRRREPA